MTYLCVDKLNTPPHLQENYYPKKPRSSNLELYRVIVMLMIVAHHYVVNSGLFGVLQNTGLSAMSSAMLLFGAWGKTGINCFLLITGYFMCKSEFSWRKLLKLYVQVAFYAIMIYAIFCITGQDTFSPLKLVRSLWPFQAFTSNYFLSCFLMFYLFIPFLNILIKALDRRRHIQLFVLLLVFYAILPSIPGISIAFNYVNWFMAIYIMASYIRIYGLLPEISHRNWGLMSLGLVLIGALSVLGLDAIYKLGYTTRYLPYFFVTDSNKFISVAIAISSFMYFKDLHIPQSKLINAFGAATFGVLLIHANSDTMRHWLWEKIVDCIGHFGPSLVCTVSYAAISVIVIFVVCAGIDWFRVRYIEPHMMQFITAGVEGLACRFRQTKDLTELR